MSTRCQDTFGRKWLRQLAMQRIVYIFTSYSATRHKSFSPVTNPKLDTFGYSAQSATFLICIVLRNLLLNLKKVHSNNGTEFKNANVDTFLDEEGFHMSSRLRTRLNKMELLRGRTGKLLRWREWCLMNTTCLDTFGWKWLRQLVMLRIDYIFTSFSARRHTSFSPVTNPKLDTFEYLAQSATFLISIIVRNLLLNAMKVSYSVMAQTLTVTVSTTISPEWLKRR